MSAEAEAHKAHAKAHSFQLQSGYRCHQGAPGFEDALACCLALTQSFCLAGQVSLKLVRAVVDSECLPSLTCEILLEMARLTSQACSALVPLCLYANSFEPQVASQFLHNGHPFSYIQPTINSCC